MGNLVFTTNESVLVINNGCDQTIININSFLIYTFAGVKYKVNGALSKMSSSSLELVSDAYTLVIIGENKKYFFKINQAFLDKDPTQNEAIIQPHQMRVFCAIVDDYAKNHIGSSNKPGVKCL